MQTMRQRSRQAYTPAPDSETFTTPNLFPYVWQQAHEPGSFDGLGDGVLADGSAAALAARDDASLAIGQFAEQFQVFVVDKHRPRPLAINKYRVFLLGADARTGTSFRHDY